MFFFLLGKQPYRNRTHDTNLYLLTYLQFEVDDFLS